MIQDLFWVLDNGAKRKDLPAEIESKSTVHRWFQKWVEQGVFGNLMREAGRCVEERGGYRLYECYMGARFAATTGAGRWNAPSAVHPAGAVDRYVSGLPSFGCSLMLLKQVLG